MADHVPCVACGGGLPLPEPKSDIGIPSVPSANVYHVDGHDCKWLLDGATRMPACEIQLTPVGSGKHQVPSGAIIKAVVLDFTSEPENAYRFVIVNEPTGAGEPQVLAYTNYGVSGGGRTILGSNRFHYTGEVVGTGSVTLRVYANTHCPHTVKNLNVVSVFLQS